MKSLTEIDLIEKGASKEKQKEEIKDLPVERGSTCRKSMQKKSFIVVGLGVLVVLGSMCFFQKWFSLEEKALVSCSTVQIERREKSFTPPVEPVSSGREKSSDNRYIEMIIVFEQNKNGVPVPKMGDIILSGIDEKNQERPTWKTLVEGQVCRAN
jgi:hypothetical protein